MLERTGERIATHVGLSGVVFGATILAAATALPELSTGIRSVRLGDYQLAVSDIFGGNAFLPVLFLVASLLSGSAVLPQAQPTDVYLTALAIVLTVVYAWGLIMRPQRQVLRMGIASLVVLVLYVDRHRRADRSDEWLKTSFRATAGAGKIVEVGSPRHDTASTSSFCLRLTR